MIYNFCGKYPQEFYFTMVEVGNYLKITKKLKLWKNLPNILGIEEKMLMNSY